MQAGKENWPIQQFCLKAQIEALKKGFITVVLILLLLLPDVWNAAE